MTNIFRQVREERDNFLNNEIEVVPGYNFSQYQTIKKIHLYYSGHYVNGDYEVVNGVTRKKVFHNITDWRCEVATKMIDLDIKDFKLVSLDPDQDVKVWLLEKELKNWLKQSEMGQILNEISENLPIYGSCVLKKTADGAKLIDMRYLYNDQAAECIDDSHYVITKSFLNHQELREMSKKGWENVQDAIDMFSGIYHQGYDMNGLNTGAGGSNLFYEGAGSQNSKNNAPLVEVFERYGQVPLSWFTDKESDDNEYVLAKYVVCGIDAVQRNDAGAIINEEGLILYKEQIDEMPFKDVHYTRTRGRWLGIGVIEKLFEDQRRINEIKDNESLALTFGAKQIFQTRDSLVATNILTDLNNGDILKVKSEITPIDTESRDMSGFASVANTIEEHANSATFSRDVVSGETPPSTATLGAVQIATAQTTAVFDYKKENIGLFLQDFIEELVFPQIEKEINREHVISVYGSLEELLRLRKDFATSQANAEMMDMVLTKDAVPTQEAWNMLFQKHYANIAKQGEKVWVKVMDKFYKNLSYYVDVVITNENKNIFADAQNAQSILGLIERDPTILQDSGRRQLLFTVMTNMGMHIQDIERIEQATQQPLSANLQQNGQQLQQPQLGQQLGSPFGGGQGVPTTGQ